MKIKLVVSKFEGKFPVENIIHTEVSSMSEANSIVKNAIDKKTYSIIKALEVNDNFIKTIQFVRKDMGIPLEGFSYAEFVSLNKKYPENSLNSRSNISTLLPDKNITKFFNIPKFIQSNLIYILWANFIYIPLTKISIESSSILSQVYESDLKISIQGLISKRQLIQFIESNWETIEKEMLRYKNDISTFISSRDRKILKLRDEDKQKFREIADYLSEKTNDPEINEDMIKRAYHRAKAKIASLEK